MNTHLEIRRPAFSRFLKAEVAEFATKTIGIVRERMPEELLIEPVLDPLEALKPEIELLSLRYGIDPDRMKIDNLKSKLMLTISNLKLQVRLIGKSNADEDLYLIDNFINTYLRKLNNTKNDKVMMQQVEGFLNSIATDAALDGALDEHGLLIHVNRIKSAFYDLRYAMSLRLEKLASRPTVNTSQIRLRIYTAINNLFKGIEIAQFVNPEIDYKPLVDELNELVSNFRLSIRLRIANNKRKAEEKKANQPDEGDIDGNGDIEGDEGMMPTTTYSSNRSSTGFSPYSLSVVSMNGEGVADEEGQETGDMKQEEEQETEDYLFEDELDDEFVKG